MKRILHIPVGFLQFVWGFVNPRRTAGRLPLGRIAIVAQIVTALVFVGYTLVKKQIHLPLTSQPYEVEVELADAQGLDRVDQPTAAVAGTPLGRVTSVRYENGTAVATLTLQSDVRGKVFADATANIRPASAIQNLNVNIAPGHPEAGPLPDGARIELANSDGFVAIDDLTSVLDSDTQAYVQILVTEAERALRGREDELRGSLAQLGKLTETATPISRVLARRRELLTRLVGDLDEVAQTTAAHRYQLAQAVDTANNVLAVTAGRQGELTDLTRVLGPTLERTNAAVAAGRRLATPLTPALNTLIPTLPDAANGLAELRKTFPVAQGLVDDFKALTDDGAQAVDLLLIATKDLKAKAESFLPTAKDLVDLAALLNRYKRGAAQTADTLSGALSVSDNGGVYGQVDVLRFEALKPENFGMTPRQANQPAGGGITVLQKRLAVGLERLCERGNASACISRFGIHGLPKDPLTREVKR